MTRSQHYISTESDNASLIRAPVGGNKCGHDPLLPRIFEPPQHHSKKKPPIIEKAKRIIYDLFFNPLSAYLNSHIFYHTIKITKKDRYRQKRSEAREAVCRVVAAMLHTFNLKNGILGFPMPEGGIFYYSLNYFAKIAKTSYHQVKAVFKALKSAGYASITERVEKRADGSIRAINPIIKLSYNIFYDLGIDQNEIRQALYKDEEKAKREDRKILKDSFDKQEKENRKNSKFKKKLSLYAKDTVEKEQIQIPSHKMFDFQPRKVIVSSQTATECRKEILAKLKPRYKPPS